MHASVKVPPRAWLVTFSGTAVNLCLGILYAWSVWKRRLLAGGGKAAGGAMDGLDEGWHYLSDAEATWAYALCGFIFAVTMIPGGRLQDRYGPKIGAVLGGLCLASGCIVAGLLKSYSGLILGFGVLGGIGMGLGYAAATPAAVKWFGPHQRGLIVGLVVGGYGAAAIYISPLAEYLIGAYGLSGSFIGLGIGFALVVIVAGSLLSWPPAGYTPPAAPVSTQGRMTREDWGAGAMLGTWQFYGLVFLFIGAAQSGLLVIANAAPMLGAASATPVAGVAISVGFFAANAWILSSFSGLVNATGRIGTGLYSDAMGRGNAYRINACLSAACLLALPTILSYANVALLFVAVGVVIWQYGGSLALMPAFTADYFGSKNLGLNYGLVFLGWGIAFFIPQFAGYVKDVTGTLDLAFYFSGGLLLVAALVSAFLTRPVKVVSGESGVSV